MTSPYVIGRWVRDYAHYGRQHLIEHILTSRDHAIWVVGTRRMGKTSLLRHIEIRTDQPDSEHVPLFVDLQGCTSSQEFSEELLFALEAADTRFEPFEIDIGEMIEWDATRILRFLGRQLERYGRQLLLLLDESEVLIEIGKQEESWLAYLRKVVQEGRQRTVVASTKLLSRLNTGSTGWATSPFLFGFKQYNLWPLDRPSAVDLVLQKKSEYQIDVGESLLEEMLVCTNHHPHLLQVLGSRLYTPLSDSEGYLRAIEEEDLIPDHLMDGFFQVDFGHLSQVEQELLLAVSEAEPVSVMTLESSFEHLPEGRIETLLTSLREHGQLQQVGEDWRLGNEFLRRWIARHHTELAEMVERSSPDSGSNVTGVGIDERGVNGVEGASVPLLRSEKELFTAVQGFFREIRHLVEQDDGHRLLVVNEGAGEIGLRSEEEIQIALKHWLRPMCRALNIQLDREPLSGRGFLDFKMTLGHDWKCLVEVKLFHSAKIEHGVDIQLPLYLLSDRAQFGIYVPVILQEEGYEDSIAHLKELARSRGESHAFQIEVIDIRAWKPRSASKARGIERLDRYQNPFDSIH